MLIACNEWSQQMLWPKVYVKADEEGVAVYSELTIAWDHGVTDEQLDLQLSTSIGSRPRLLPRDDQAVRAGDAPARRSRSTTPRGPPQSDARRRGRRTHGDRQVRPRARRSRRRSAARWSTPTPCSCTAAWTSAPRSFPPTSGGASRTTSWTCWTCTRTRPSPTTRRGRARRSARSRRAATGGRRRRFGPVRPGAARPHGVPRDRPERPARGSRHASRPRARGRCTPSWPALDPVARRRHRPRNARRIVRALEVIEITGRPYSASLPQHVYEVPAVQIGLDCDRAVLDARIEGRVERMWEPGLVDEVERAASRTGWAGPRRAPSGTRRSSRCCAASSPADEALDAVAAGTRRLARKQMGWFGRDPRVHWLDAQDPEPRRAGARPRRGRGRR